MTESNNDTLMRRRVADLVIPHDSFRQMLERMECLWRGAQAGIPTIAPFVGETGTGKTTAIRVFRARHPPARTPDGLTIPVLCAQTPSKPTPRALAERILEKLNDPRPTAGSAAAKMDRIIRMLRATQVRVITLDDMQHFVDKRQQVAIYEAADYLKELLASCDIVVLAFGLPGCELVIQSNEQLETRSKAIFYIKRFNWSDPASRQQFVAVLAEFLGILKEFELPDLTSPEMSLRMYLGSGGLIRHVSKILGNVIGSAIDRNIRSIRLEDFAKAWEEEVVPPSKDYANPFSGTFTLTDLPAKVAEAKAIGMHVPRPVPARQRSPHQVLAEIGL